MLLATSGTQRTDELAHGYTDLRIQLGQHALGGGPRATATQRRYSFHYDGPLCSPRAPEITDEGGKEGVGGGEAKDERRPAFLHADGNYGTTDDDDDDADRGKDSLVVMRMVAGVELLSASRGQRSLIAAYYHYYYYCYFTNRQTM